MFVDLCDFTARAEASTARETVAFLKEFFDVVVPCVIEHGGHTNKFLGDGVLAVFGAPERLSDHADRATRSTWRPACRLTRAKSGLSCCSRRPLLAQ